MGSAGSQAEEALVRARNGQCRPVPPEVVTVGDVVRRDEEHSGRLGETDQVDTDQCWVGTVILLDSDAIACLEDLVAVCEWYAKDKG